MREQTDPLPLLILLTKLDQVPIPVLGFLRRHSAGVLILLAMEKPPTNVSPFPPPWLIGFCEQLLLSGMHVLTFIHLHFNLLSPFWGRLVINPSPTREDTYTASVSWSRFWREDASKATSRTSLCAGSCSSKAPGNWTKLQIYCCCNNAQIVQLRCGIMQEGLVRAWLSASGSQRLKQNRRRCRIRPR